MPVDSTKAFLSSYLARFSPNAEPSLVTRLLLLLLLGTVIVFTIGIVGLHWASSRMVQSTMEKQALQWIAELQELGPPVSGGRAAHRFLIQGRLRHFPEIAFVRYYDATGNNVLSEYGESSGRVPMPTRKQLEKLSRADSGRPYLSDQSVPVDDSQFSANFVRILSPIRARSIRADGLFGFDPRRKDRERVEVIGYLDLGINPNLHRGSFARTIAFAGFVAAIVFFAALLIGRRLIRRALAPLIDLQKPLARLASGDIDVRVNTRGAAEIAAVGRALNATISALKERDATLRRLADHDSLTGLLNRASFLRLLDAEIARVRQEGPPSALLFIDLDRFKYLNDMLGHAGGDRLLVQVADLIRGRMRETDAVARFGGDEFTVLLRHVSRAGAIEIARLINDILRDFYFVDQGQTFNVCCSIGVTMITTSAGSAEEMLLQADTACYEAKSGGRNRFHLFERGQREIGNTIKDVGRSELIKQALKENTMQLVFQPIVSVSGPEREYYEVLLRMPDEEGRLVSPAAFLPVAERFGLLADMDRWVIEHALKALAEFRAEGRDITFSVNLSGQALEDPAIVKLIKERLRQYHVPPTAVVFEITEQIAVRYMNKAKRLMQSLIDLGCRFSLDDFGVGFSSFNYLKNFPVSYIKIDGSFVENLASDSIDQAMVKSIVQIGQALGKEVIAEFVQDDETIRLLRQYGVDYLQGHHIGTPCAAVPHPRFARAVAKNMQKKTAGSSLRSR